MSTMTRIGKILLLPLALTAVGALGACATDGAAKLAPATTPSEQWTDKVKVEAQPDEVRLSPHRTGLSANQGDALGAFMGRWIEADGGQIVIQAPTGGGGDPAAAYAVATQSRDFLIANGAPANMVRIDGYDAKGEPSAPVIVGFLSYRAIVPECGKAWGNLSSSSSNQPSGNFGCAVTANIAAQVANPADLDHPRTMGPADAGRRAMVTDHYRKGEATSSAKDAQASGAVSKAVD
jgi:pilus assembly protein CpaD